MKKIVTIGGGSGQSTLLRYLKQYPLELTAIVSMVDDGGSTGQLRDQLGILPPGDLRRCLIALAQTNEPLQQLLGHRFAAGDLHNHTVGNIMLAGLAQQCGDMAQATAIVSDWLQCKGRILPVTLSNTTLYAQLSNTTVIKGETNIDVPKHDPTLTIQHVYLEPTATIYPPVINALKQADYIVLTIGDLYTSVIPNLLVAGITSAIQQTNAQLIYTCNASNKIGETDGFTPNEYVHTLQQYLGNKALDYIIVEQTTSWDNTACPVPVISADIVADDKTTISGAKLAKVVAELCQR